MQYLMAFDTETGDIDPNKGDLLTAYFGILDEDMKIVDELDLRLKPDGGRIPVAAAGALKVNGINIQDHLANPETITYSEAKTKLVAMLKKYLKKTGRYSNIRPYGYNILGFDNAWVQHYILPKEEWDTILHYKSVDVMQQVDFLKRSKWFPAELGSLVTVVEYLGLPKLGAHEAKNDVLMTISVDKAIVQMMAAKKDGGQAQDLISLLEAE